MSAMDLKILIFCIVFCTVPVLCAEPSIYLVGRGIADVTGPVVDVIMVIINSISFTPEVDKLLVFK